MATGRGKALALMERSSVRWLAVGCAAVVFAFAAGHLSARDGGGDESGDVERAGSPVVDDFSTGRGQFGLGETPTGQPWRQVEGRWTVRNGLAHGAGRDGVTIASVDPGGSVGLIQVVVGDVVAGSGVVFRFGDTENHWALLAAPAVARWNLVKTVNGERTDVESYGPARVDAGTALIIRLDGDQIEIEIDGTVVGDVRDPDLADRNAVGFFIPDGGQASFDQIITGNGPSSTPEPSTPPTSTPTPTSTNRDEQPAENPPDEGGPLSVLLAGDSMLRETSHSLIYGLEGSGTAGANFCACGSLPRTGADRVVWEGYLEQYSPSLVVMQVGHWEAIQVETSLVPGEAFNPESYRSDVLDPFVDMLFERGVQQIIWLAPVTVRDPAENARFDLLEPAYRALAEDDSRIDLVDGDPLLAPDGFQETTVGQDGAVVPLRRADGVHLCPYGQLLLAQLLLDRIGAQSGLEAPAGWQDEWLAAQPPEPNGCAAEFQP